MFKGYDGNSYEVGDRVELHPRLDGRLHHCEPGGGPCGTLVDWHLATNLWMRGARFGVVVGSSLTPKDRVRVRLDKFPKTTFGASEDTFRAI